MRRLAFAALGAGFAICALVYAPAAGASGLVPGSASATVASHASSPSPKPSGSRKPSPKPSGKPSPKPSGSSSQKGKQKPAKPSGPPAPTAGMPQPSHDCRTQVQGRPLRRVTTEPWAQRALSFSNVWGRTQGQHVTVAVVDSGIDDIPQLAGRVSYADLSGGNGEDCVGHGTMVASIIAASDARSRGISFYGVAPAAHILAIRAEPQAGTQGLSKAAQRKTIENIAAGIKYAVLEHARVINVSIQIAADIPVVRSAVEYALHHNVVVVAAAGNTGSGCDRTPCYPASYPGVLSVNAVDRFGQRPSFDVRGTPVSVTAPGAGVTGGWPGGFFVDQGTSFAAAFVSGEAALVRSAYPKLSAAQVVKRIEETADGSTGAHTGAGMINPVQAVTEMLPQADTGSVPPGQVVVPQRKGVNHFTRTVALSVTGGALALVAIVAAAAIVVPQGRQRRWRPARLGSPPMVVSPPAGGGQTGGGSGDRGTAGVVPVPSGGSRGTDWESRRLAEARSRRELAGSARASGPGTGRTQQPPRGGTPQPPPGGAPQPPPGGAPQPPSAGRPSRPAGAGSTPRPRAAGGAARPAGTGSTSRPAGTPGRILPQPSAPQRRRRRR